MQNVKASIKDKTLTIIVDLAAPTRPSASGKTQVIASTQGNQNVGLLGDKPIIVGLNVYTK